MMLYKMRSDDIGESDPHGSIVDFEPNHRSVSTFQRTGEIFLSIDGLCCSDPGPASFEFHKIVYPSNGARYARRRDLQSVGLFHIEGDIQDIAKLAADMGAIIECDTARFVQK